MVVRVESASLCGTDSHQFDGRIDTHDGRCESAFMDHGLTMYACPSGTIPIYRVFNNRHDANHRYMTSTVVRAQMEAAGWIREGDGPNATIMCAVDH